MKVTLPYACDKNEEYVFLTSEAINAFTELFQRVEAASARPPKWVYTGVLPAVYLVTPRWHSVSFYRCDQYRTGFATIAVQVMLKPSNNVATVKTSVEKVNLKPVHPRVVENFLNTYIPF